MSYVVILSPNTKIELLLLKKSEPKAFEKAMNLIDELHETPEAGTGHPKPLGSSRTGQWSRRITQKHRLTYKINKEEQIVEVISARNHYTDK
ncbi:MAG: Txe/YoeB family addiction module toxin [Prevotellaceae bacterium]|jgi:toxin YoeB|nr:Txe/YoeB family addiction module toxin [Prevotellaceae bacterium]